MGGVGPAFRWPERFRPGIASTWVLCTARPAAS